MSAIYERSKFEHGALWLAHKRCLAERGDAEAQLSVAIAHRDGDYTPQHDAEALRWFRIAAENGNAMALLNIGQFYETGRAVPQNYSHAHMWYNLAQAAFTSADHMGRAWAMEGRRRVEAYMTPQEIASAQELARQWWASSQR